MAEYGTGCLLVACTQLFFSLCSFVVCRRGFVRLARVCTVQITVRAVCGEARSSIANSAFGCTAPPPLGSTSPLCAVAVCCCSCVLLLCCCVLLPCVVAVCCWPTRALQVSHII